MDHIWELVRNSKGHTGSDLEVHLEGTAALLEEWGQRESVRLAGLYHAVYGNPGGRSAICSPDVKALASRIGEEAEFLVRIWAVLDRSRLRKMVYSFKAGDEPIQLASHTGESLDVSRQQYVDLAHIHVANLIEVASRTNMSLNDKLLRLHPALSKEAYACLKAHYPEGWRFLIQKLQARCRESLRRL